MADISEILYFFHSLCNRDRRCTDRTSCNIFQNTAVFILKAFEHNIQHLDYQFSKPHQNKSTYKVECSMEKTYPI